MHPLTGPELEDGGHPLVAQVPEMKPLMLRN
jgi:hypothetical protein